MHHLYIVTGLSVFASFAASRTKTLKALKIAVKKFANIFPSFFVMLALVSITLFLVPGEIILHYLGSDNKFASIFFALFFGSITLMPGFIAFPLSGILLKEGVPFMVLSAFTTTLMTVGVLTYPIEKEYFGAKVTIMRNLISLFIAIVVAVITGIFFGEIF